MSLPIQNTDRDSTALNLLIDIFQSKENFVKLLSSYTEATQEAENLFFDVFNKFVLTTAEGDQLNAIGEILGADRNGANDITYRIRLQARILLNLTSGTPNQILELVVLILSVATNAPSPAPIFIPSYPAAFEIDATGIALSQDEANELGNAVQEATPAGVYSQTLYGLSPTGQLFRFSASSSSETGATTKGFSDLSQVTGGKLAGVA